MNKSKSFIASIISTTVSGLYIIALLYMIVTSWLNFKKSGMDDIRMAVEGSLYLVLLLIIIITFALSLTLLIFKIKKKDIFTGQGRQILLSTIFFDFFVAFLFFIISLSGVGVLFAILYVVGLIGLVVSGALYLVDYNEDIKFKKANKNKIDNTAVQDNFYKINEIMDNKESGEKKE